MAERVIGLPPQGITRRTFIRTGGLAALGLALGVNLKSRNGTMPAEKASAVESKTTSETTLNSDPEFKTIINHGIEVFGNENPITNKDIPQFVDFLNNRDKDVKLDPITYYGTIFVYKDVYKQFPEDNGESLESFLSRHEQALTEIIINAGGSQIRLNKLVILDAEIGESVGGVDKIEKSDGFWILNQIYRPFTSPYYDSKTHIDWGLEHELGHGVLHQRDGYPLNMQYNENLVLTTETLQALGNIPTQWRSYIPSDRTDTGRDIMSSVGSYTSHKYRNEEVYPLGRYMSLDLLNRIKTNRVHVKERVSWTFPNEIPKVSNLFFGPDYADQEIELYRSFEVDPDKRPDYYTRKKALEKIGTYTLSEKGVLTLLKDDIFIPEAEDNNLIKAEDCVLFIKTKDGKACRWMSVTDFNIPYWLGNEEEADMYLKMATASDQPDTFPWYIYLP